MDVVAVQQPSGFDWDLHEASGERGLRINHRIRKQAGDGMRVYSWDPGAQALYDALSGPLKLAQPPVSGSIMAGRVSMVQGNCAWVDVGWREEVQVDLKKESAQSREILGVGEEVDVLVERVDRAGNRPSVASHTRMAVKRVKDELMDNIGKRFAFAGRVESMIEGAGYIMDMGGVKCFMPGSLAGMNKVIDFQSLVGKELYVVPINYSVDRDCVVVSHREYLKSLVPEEMAKIREGDRLTGTVTGTSHHGVFVEFSGCLTGLASRADLLPETVERFADIRPGEDFSFWVKAILPDSRLVLSEKPVGPSPWDTVDQLLNKEVVGTVKKVVGYGVFVEIAPRVVGLLHRSYLTEADVFAVGQDVEVVVVRVDKAARQVDLAI